MDPEAEEVHGQEVYEDNQGTVDLDDALEQLEVGAVVQNVLGLEATSYFVEAAT